eukprot:7148837-Alexandrium_andersonii.AAC.1
MNAVPFLGRVNCQMPPKSPPSSSCPVPVAAGSILDASLALASLEPLSLGSLVSLGSLALPFFLRT